MMQHPERKKWSLLHSDSDSWRNINSQSPPDSAGICGRAVAAAFPSGLPQSEEAIRSIAADFADEVLEKLEPLEPFLPP
jgi:hypothetical protein